MIAPANEAPTLDLTPIASIHVGARHRKDMGDVDALAASIGRLGLLCPVVLNGEGGLVAGCRRLEAVKRLGWTEVPAITALNLDDAQAALMAERDENTCRKDFTPSEAVEAAAALEPFERQAARQRQASLNGKAKDASEKVTEASKGEAKDKVAAAVGMSRPTLERAKIVVEKGVPELVRAVDERTVSIAAAADVTECPPERQREVVAAGRQAVKDEAKRIREEREARFATDEEVEKFPVPDGPTPGQKARADPAVNLSRAVVEVWGVVNGFHMNGTLGRLKQSATQDQKRRLRESIDGLISALGTIREALR